jgi:hypothetical protein
LINLLRYGLNSPETFGAQGVWLAKSNEKNVNYTFPRVGFLGGEMAA